MVSRASRLAKVSLLASLLFVTLIAHLEPATEFERSVYHAVPAWGWILFGCVIGLSMTVVALAYSQRGFGNGLVGIGSLLVAFFGFFFIPFSRGYYLNSGYKADTLFHLGLVKIIISNGELPYLTYPGIHALTASLKLLTGGALNDLPWLVSFVFFAFFVASIAFCTWSISSNQRLTLLVTASAFTLLFAKYRYEVMPWIYGTPFIFVITGAAHQYLEANRRAWLGVIGISIIVLVVTHPFTSIYALLFLTSYLFIRVHESAESSYPVPDMSLAVWMGVSLFAYHLFHGTVFLSFGGSIARLVSAAQAGPGAATAQDAAGFDYTLSQYLTRFIIPQWGDIFIYGGIAGIVTLSILYRWVNNESDVPLFQKLLVSQFVVGGGLAVAILVLGFFGSSIRRAGQYPILISIFLVGFGLYMAANYLEKNVESPRQTAVVVGMVVLVLTPIVLFSAATTYQPNRHITDKVADGTSWELEHRDRSHPVIGRPSGGRLSQFFLGFEGYRESSRNGEHIYYSTAPPDDLGYGSAQTIGRALAQNSDSYLITKTDDRRWYLIEPEWRRDDISYYTSSDYDKLTADDTAVHVYDNGGFGVWMVEELGEENE